MKTKLQSAILIALVVVCFAAFTGYGQRQERVPRTPVWEYKTGVNLTEAQLNQHGTEGWELVSVAIYSGEKSAQVNYFYLKRAK